MPLDHSSRQPLARNPNGRKSSNEATPPRSRHWATIEPVLRRGGLHKANTLRAYEQGSRWLNRFPDPSKITQKQLDELRDEIRAKYQGQGPRGRMLQVRTILRRVYGRSDLILRIPAWKPRVKDVLEVEDIQKILDHIDQNMGRMNHALLLTQYESCMRPGELCALNVDDVNLDTKEVRVRDAKTGDRVVNLSDRAVESLRRWLKIRAPFQDEHGQALFWSRKRRHRVQRHYLNGMLKEAAKRAGINQRVYPHMIRATGITHLLNAGVNPVVVQRQAGHANIATTWIYNRPTMKDQRRILDEAWGRINVGSATAAETGTAPRPPVGHLDNLIRLLTESLQRREITAVQFQRALDAVEAPAGGDTG